MWKTRYLGRTVLGRRMAKQSFENSRSYMEGLVGRLGIVGVPFGKGQKKEGIAETGLIQAPDVLRSIGFIEEIKNLGVDVKDYGNVCYSPMSDIALQSMANLNHVAPCTQQINLMVSKVLSDKRICLTLGGDHSMAIGSISAHLSIADPQDVAVLYVDAHADINLNSTSSSSNMHGMTLGLLAQELVQSWPECIPGFDWLQPCLSLKNLAYIGLRSVDPWERVFINKYCIPAYSMEEVQRFGIHNVVQMALRQIDPSGCKSIHLSFDIDALDYHEAPCTTVPVRGGLTLREAIDIAECVHRTKRLAAMDLVEVNPCLGNEYQRQITLDAARHILLASFGHSRKGNPC